jgi:hypothetical protein
MCGSLVSGVMVNYLLVSPLLTLLQVPSSPLDPTQDSTTMSLT